MRHDNWINRALDIAAVSTMSQKHGAVLLQGSRVLSVGVNTQRNSPDTSIPYDGLSVHAEMSVLDPLRHWKHQPSNLTLYVARLGRNGKQMGSQPCVACFAELTMAPQIKRVVFSYDYEGYGILKV